MAYSDAQREATNRYRRKLRMEGRMKSVTVEFYEADLDLYEYIAANEPTAPFVKGIIREHMERNRNEAR